MKTIGKLFLLCLFLCVSIGASAYNKNDFGVYYTVEHTNIAGERWSPIFHIVWPDDFNADRYKVIIYINYNVQTTDGQWHIMRSAMIYGSSGKYELAERYTKPIQNVKITITEIDDDNVQQSYSEPKSRYDDGYGGATYALGNYMNSAASMVNVQSDMYPNLQLMGGMDFSGFGTEAYARVKTCMGGAGGMAIWTGLGTNPSWHAGIGWYISFEGYHVSDLNYGVEYATMLSGYKEKRISLDFTYTYWISDTWGLYITGGFGMYGPTAFEELCGILHFGATFKIF
ncbi:MAG: hypothetical protein KBS55_01620 [Bacteroidales bacterium]|nr:hypothetical protein [Candidatus Cryptobacteroides aphodequi]